MCIFARQDVTIDPPFSKMDLISCRNVMIYFEPGLQHRLIPLFHYALKPTGFLLLGGAENIGRFTHLFEVSRAKNETFSETARPPAFFRNRQSDDVPRSCQLQGASEGHRNNGHEITRKADKALIDRFSPPAVVVDQDLEILQFRGAVTPYLQPASGKASLNLFSMTLPALEFEFRTLIDQAKNNQRGVHREGLQVDIGGIPQRLRPWKLSLSAGPKPKLVFHHCLCRDGRHDAHRGSIRESRRTPGNCDIAQLENELLTAKETSSVDHR